MIKKTIKILLPLLFILSNTFICQSLNSILKIKYLRMDGPNSATIQITVPLGDGWYDAKIIVKDRGVEQVVWQRSLMEESETITVDYQVTNLEIDSLVEISAWAEFKLPEGRQGPLRKSDKRYLLSKGDEILQSFDESYIYNFEVEYEKKKRGYENYTQEYMEYIDPEFAMQYERKHMKDWSYETIRIYRRDEDGNIRESYSLQYNSKGLKEGFFAILNAKNEIRESIYFYYNSNEDTIFIKRSYREKQIEDFHPLLNISESIPMEQRIVGKKTSIVKVRVDEMDEEMKYLFKRDRKYINYEKDEQR